MNTGTIKSVAVKMRGQAQASFTGSNGTTTYYFIVEMEDGTKGEVGGKTPMVYRFKAGDEVQYEYTPNANPEWLGKFKIEKVGGFQNGGRGGSFNRPQGSPARFLLAAIIQAGVKSDQWENALVTAMMVLVKVDKPAPAPEQPQPNGRPAVAMPAVEEDDLPPF